MLGDSMLVLVGFALLLGGGEGLVRGAAALARGLGVSPLVIGLTVVSFGTSAPELAVNVSAALRDASGISFGNIFGSNMANIGLIIAASALVQPLSIQSTVLLRELPMMLLGTAVAVVLAVDGLFGDPYDVINRGDGLVLLLLFCVFLYYTAFEVQSQRRSSNSEFDEGDTRPAVELPGVWGSLGITAAGLVGLVIGAQLTIEGAVGLAVAFGIPEVIIGLTLVAVGTSLPELAASVIAAMRGHADIAVGNVVGSNIFNLLLVLGVCAAIRPVDVPDGGRGDMLVVLMLSLLLYAVAATRERRIIRVEAALLMALYFGYVVARSVLGGGS